MKVLLVQGYLENNYSFATVPIGLCYIRRVLEDGGHDVRLYDPNISKAPDVDRELVSILTSDAYDCVGISLRNVDNNLMNNPKNHYLWLAKAARMVKEHSPQSVVMAGGSGFSMFAEVIMKRNEAIDVGVQMYGTDAMGELIGTLRAPSSVKGVFYRESGQVVYSGNRNPPDLDALPAAPWRGLDLEPYKGNILSFGVLSKVGCVFKCNYCTYPSLSGSRFVARSPVKIVDDIEYLVTEQGVTSVFMVDSIFNYPLNHCLDVCREITRRKIKVEWTGYFVEKFFTEELADAAAEAGCTQFGFSPDGMADNTMSSMGKISKEADVRRARKIIESRPNLRASFNFFLNPPEQNLRGVLKLAGFYLSAKLFSGGRIHASLWYPRVYPNTPLHTYAIKHSHFPASADALLPENDADLSKLFWINNRNRYLNFVYFKLHMPLKRLRGIIARLLGRPTP